MAAPALSSPARRPAGGLGPSPRRGRVGPMVGAMVGAIGRRRPVPLPPAYPGADPLNGYNVLPWPVASFETTTLAGYWQATNATLAQVTGGFDGTNALQLTSTSGGDCSAATSSTVYPVQAGQTYYGQFQASTTTAGVTAAIEVDWFDTMGNQISAVMGPYAGVAATSGLWTRIVGPVGGFKAPAAAVSCRVVVHANTPAGSTIVLADAVYLGVEQEPAAFTSNTYISFDPPNTPNPAFIDITPYVEVDAAQIQITRGRQDGLSDVNASSLACTLDNSDGRFTEANPNGPWYGALHKGNWIKQTVTFDGQQYTRFTGFIATLPTASLGMDQTSGITATDWFGKIGQYAMLSTLYFEELSHDPTGAVLIAYYPLNTQVTTSGTQSAPQVVTANDYSGYQGNNNNTALAPRNVASGGTVGWAQASAPGYDGDQGVTFQPISSSQGTVLRGLLSQPVGQYWCLEFWMQVAAAAGTNNEVTLVTLADYSAPHQIQIIISLTRSANGDTSDGYLRISTQPTTTSSSAARANFAFDPGTFPGWNTPYLEDGNWHHIAVLFAPDGSGNTNANVYVDGRLIWYASFASNLTTLQTLTVGGRDDILNAPGQNAGDPPGPANCLAGSIYGLAVLNTTACPQTPNITIFTPPTPSISAHYQAGATGFAGETVAARLTRIARYIGMPAAWTNFGSLSNVGSQQLLGRYPLDVMREAARAEASPFYCATDGRLTIKPRSVRFNGVSAWTVTFADNDKQSQLGDDFAYLINEVDVSRTGGTTVKAIGPNGTASQAKYGLYYTSQQTASASDFDALNLGLWLVAATYDPKPRLAPVTFEAASLSAAANPLFTTAGYGSGFYIAVLNSDVSTFCTVTGVPAVAAPTPQMHVLEGGTETIDHGLHTFTWHTSLATGMPVFTSVFQLDTNPYNQLDSTNVLAF